MIHYRFAPIETSRRPTCGRRHLRNWPIIPTSHRRMRPMDNFLDEIFDFDHVVLPSPINKPKTEMSKVKGDEKKKELVVTPTKFQINLNIAGYTPEELSVKTMDNFVTIEGKHEESSENSLISRSFLRKWAIPDGVKIDELNCNFNSKDSVLQLEAPRVVPEEKGVENVIRIPIQFTRVKGQEAADKVDGKTPQESEKMIE